jgi:hypothetical protein
MKNAEIYSMCQFSLKDAEHIFDSRNHLVQKSLKDKIRELYPKAQVLI